MKKTIGLICISVFSLSAHVTVHGAGAVKERAARVPREGMGPGRIVRSVAHERRLEAPGEMNRNQRLIISPGAPRMETLNLGMIQYQVEYNMTEAAFLKRFRDETMKAAKGKTDLIIFPELITLDLLSSAKLAASGYSSAEYSRQSIEIARNITPKLIELAKDLSYETGRAILAGTTPREIEGGKIVNTAILVFPNGQVVMQDKIFRTHDEKKWEYTPGNELHVIDAPWGRTVILTCFDIQFPGLSEALTAQNVEVVLVPSMTDEYGFDRVQNGAKARAQELHAYVVQNGVTGNSAIGDGGFGLAAVYSPQEKGYPRKHIVMGPENKPALVEVELNMAQIRASKIRSRTNPGREEVERGDPFTMYSPENSTVVTVGKKD